MDGAGCGLDEDGLQIREVANGMDLSSRVAAVFCKAAGYIASECCQVFAEQRFASCAVEAGEAGL